MNRRVLGSLVVTVLAGALVSGCKAPAQASTGSSETGRKIRTVTFDPAALQRLGVKVDIAGNKGADYELEVPGELEYGPETYAEVGTVVEGRVTQIFVKVGSPVKKGQALATIIVPSIANVQAEYVSAEAASKPTCSSASSPPRARPSLPVARPSVPSPTSLPPAQSSTCWAWPSPPAAPPSAPEALLSWRPSTASSCGAM
jgi:hypothetical protein